MNYFGNDHKVFLRLSIAMKKLAQDIQKEKLVKEIDSNCILSDVEKEILRSRL